MTNSVAGPTMHRLDIRWRRAMVTISATAGAALVFLQFTDGLTARVRFGAGLVLAVVLLTCLWFLGDVIRPWVTSEDVDPEERAHADAAVRRSYGTLCSLAIAAAVYLVYADSRPHLLPTAPGDGVVVLAAVIGTILLLPIGLSAWYDPAGPYIPVGPLRIVRLRFTGAAATTHGATAGLVLIGAALLMLAASPGGESGPVRTAAVLLALCAVVAAGVYAVHLLRTVSRREGRERGE